MSVVENIKSKELVEKTEQELESFKSLYYLLKGKRDTEIKLFTRYKQFRKCDIIDLNDKIYKKLRNHELVTDIVNVTVGLDKNEIKTFGNWFEYSNYDWNISSRTQYISIEWDFNIILPNSQPKIPQTHTLRVRMGNGIKPNEMIQVLFQGGEEEYELEAASAQVVCKIDFVNSQICSELKTIVSNWYDSLSDNSQDQKIVPMIVKNSTKFNYLIRTFFLSAGVIFINFLMRYFLSISSTETNVELCCTFFTISSVSLIIIYLFYNTGILYSSRILKKSVNEFRRNPMFEFTKGDENYLLKVKEINKKGLKKLFWGLFWSIVANGLTILLGKALPHIHKFFT